MFEAVEETAKATLFELTQLVSDNNHIIVAAWLLRKRSIAVFPFLVHACCESKKQTFIEYCTISFATTIQDGRRVIVC